MNVLLRSVQVLLALALVLPAELQAQLISVKTVPIATGDQFLIFPSRNQAMGGVSIALDDPLLDPFVNPAHGSRLDQALLFGAPAFHRIAGNNGNAKTLPVGGIVRSDRLFGGAVFALQELTAPRSQNVWPVWRDLAVFDQWFVPPVNDLLTERSATNLYAFGMIGSRLDERHALGVSVFLADLSRLEGVELLYPNSNGIQQTGQLANVRIGLTRDDPDGTTAEALLLFNRVDMRHDVTYVRWEPTPDPVDEEWNGNWVPRVEENLDVSNTYGLHFKGAMPVGDEWRLGGQITGNYKTHPKIPNYDLMQIPRDPGSSRAFDFGIGVSRTYGRGRFGLDLVYEPIWSDTWAEAAEPTETAGGGVIAIGGKTVENEFDFGNAAMRIGAGRIGDRVDLFLGLQVAAIRYDLDQRDHVAEDRRFQHEEWQEWTGTAGVTVKFDEFHIRYSGRFLSGTGRPGVAASWMNERNAAMDFAAAADVILAPSGALTLQETRVVTHQLSVTIPIAN